MPKLTPEQQRRRQERSAREATFPKCDRCSNVLGVQRVRDGFTLCRACLPDETIQQREVAASPRLSNFDKASIFVENVSDETTRLALRAILQLIQENRHGDGAN